ncbi:hypothetical protein ACM66B_006776 [Microbotryomycetes sp. NB124-2]
MSGESRPYQHSPLRSSFSAEDLNNLDNSQPLQRSSRRSLSSPSSSDNDDDNYSLSSIEEGAGAEKDYGVSSRTHPTSRSTRRSLSFTKAHSRRDSKLDKILKSAAGAGASSHARADDDEEKQGLLDQLVPEPNRPRALWRTTATVILCLFFFVVFARAFISPPPTSVEGPAEGVEEQMKQVEAGTGWFDHDWVPWKGSKSEQQEDEQDFDLSAAQELEEVDTDVASDAEPEVDNDTPNETAQPDSDASSVSATDATVASLLASGAIHDYKWHHTLKGWADSARGRLIVVGDVHGMVKSLYNLLNTMSYSRADDTLVVVGDLVAKSSVESSLAAVKLLRESNAVGVRGNNDQGVIAWRRWMEAHGRRSSSFVAGHDRLKSDLAKEEQFASADTAPDRHRFAKLRRAVDAELTEDGDADVSPEGIVTPTPLDSPLATFASATEDGSLSGAGYEWLDAEESDLANFGISVPAGWHWGGDWFQIAKALPARDLEYLASLPLTLYLEEIETYVVHAGLVPWTDSAQERVAVDSKSPDPRPAEMESASTTQFEPSPESEIVLSSSAAGQLLLVSPNTDPFTLLNMRTLTMKHPSSKEANVAASTQVTYVPSRHKKGTPWYDEWNEVMSECTESTCQTVNVLYGHWAGKGLTVNPFSIGLDSACVAGQFLSAFVVEKKQVWERKKAVGGKEGVDGFRKFENGQELSGKRPMMGGLKDVHVDERRSRRVRKRDGEEVEASTGAVDSDEVSEQDVEDAFPNDSMEDSTRGDKQTVEFAGLRAEIVSVDCSREADSYA